MNKRSLTSKILLQECKTIDEDIKQLVNAAARSVVDVHTESERLISSGLTIPQTMKDDARNLVK